MNGLFEGHYVEWQRKRFEAIRNHFGEKWFQGKKVLELAAGHGDIGNMLASLGASVFICDGRPEHMQNAHKNLQGRWVVDLNTDWIPEETVFDLIVNSGVLYHLADPETCIKNTMQYSLFSVIETEVVDSKKKDFKIEVNEQTAFYDQAIDSKTFQNKAFRHPESFFEEMIEKHGHDFQRFFNSCLNSSPHIYDWKLSGSDRWIGAANRRFWFTKKR